MSLTTTASRLLAPAVAAVALTAGLVAAPAAPSTAAETSWVRGVNGVLYPGCHYQPFRYAIDPDKAAYDWSLEVNVYDPRGVEVTGAWLWKDEGDPSSGTTKGDDGFSFCDSERAGRYTVTAELNMYGGPYTDEQLAESTFTMREARSRTRLTVSDATAAKGQRLKFRVRSAVEYPRGYFGAEYEKVVLQKRVGGKWKRMAAGYTNSNGRAVATLRWTHARPVRVRAVTARTDEFTRSASRPVKIR